MVATPIPPDYDQYGQPTAQVSAQNPTLVPNVDPLLVFPGQHGGPGVSAFVSPAEFLQLNPRENGTATVTFTGSVTAGDTSTIDLVNGVLPGGHLTFNVISTSTDTLTTLAEKFLALFNSSPIAQEFGIFAQLSVVSSNPVLTIFWPGSVSIFAEVESDSFVYTATATVTNSSITAADVLNLTFSSPNLNQSSGRILLGGTVTTGDVIAVTFINPALPLGSVTHSYTAAGGNTLSTIASALVALFNADANLTALGFNSSANVGGISFIWGAGFGLVEASVAITRAALDTITLAFIQPSAPSALAPTPLPSEQITIGGTPTTGEILTVIITTQQGQTKAQVSYTVQSGDTTPTLVATGLVNAINASAPLQSGNFAATQVGPVITVTWSAVVGGTGWAASVLAIPSETYSLEQPVSAVVLSYIVQGGDTNTTIATAFKNAMNADVILNSGLIATSSAGVVTMSFSGGFKPLGIVFTANGGATESIAIAFTSGTQKVTVGGSVTVGDYVSIKFANDDIPFSPVVVSYDTITADTTTTIATGLAALINDDFDLAEAGITATSSGAIVSVITAGTDFLPTLTAWANGQPTVTITGTPTVGDYVNVTMTNAALPSGVHNVQYQVQSTDITLTILAASVAHAINNDAVCETFGITATNVIGVVHIFAPPSLGTFTIAAATNGLETVTVTGTPTNGEMPSITFTDAAITGSPVTIPYTVVAPGDTNAIIATNLAAAINTNAAVHAFVTASSGGAGVIDLVSKSPNQTAYSRTNSTNTTLTLAGGPGESVSSAGAATETASVSNTSTGSEVLTSTSPLVGGAGPIIPTNNFVFSNPPQLFGANAPVGAHSSVMDFWINKPVLVDYDTLQALVTQGMPIK